MVSERTKDITMFLGVMALALILSGCAHDHEESAPPEETTVEETTEATTPEKTEPEETVPEETAPEEPPPTPILVPVQPPPVTPEPVPEPVQPIVPEPVPALPDTGPTPINQCHTAGSTCKNIETQVEAQWEAAGRPSEPMPQWVKDLSKNAK